MAKTYIRVDDRLIHGQTIIAWCPILAIQEIIAIDDVSAMNPMLKSILAMGAPSMYKTHIVTTQEAKELLRTDNSKNRLVIIKATGIFYLSDQDVSIIDGLTEKGFTVFFQQLPSTSKISWKAFKKN